MFKTTAHKYKRSYKISFDEKQLLTRQSLPNSCPLNAPLPLCSPFPSPLRTTFHPAIPILPTPTASHSRSPQAGILQNPRLAEKTNDYSLGIEEVVSYGVVLFD